MKSLIEYIVESYALNEGGNAVTANPIPAYITPIVYKEIEDAIKAKNPKVKIVPLGSVGKKKDDQFNGDIDCAIDITDRDELIQFLEEVFPGMEMNKFTTANIVSISYPYNVEGEKGNAQVDFMMTHNIDWAKWRFQSPDFRKGESKYKADPKIVLTRFIVTAIPVKDAKVEYFEDGETVKKKWKYTFNTEGIFLQLLDYTGKKGPLKNPKRPKEFEKMIYNDPVNVMRFIFGDNYDEVDFHSVEGLWKALHDPKKFVFGDDAIEEVEERFYKEYIHNPKAPVKLDPEDFPCKIYKDEE